MNQFRTKAVKLRKMGYSYSFIKDKIGVSKSTLSNWLSRIEFQPNSKVLERIGRAKLKSALYKQKLKFHDIKRRRDEAFNEVGKLRNRDLLMLGIGLYLGEGSKAFEEIKIANADPAIMKLALKWLKIFCKLRNKHFRVTIHAYPDTNPFASIKFWSRTLGLPISQFNKLIVDNREKKSALRKRKLPFGTAHLYVRSGGTLYPGVKSLHRKIMSWIKCIESQM